MEENCDKMRSDRMIEWILQNKQKIDDYSDGNIQFSYRGRTLKVKDENYKNIV